MSDSCFTVCVVLLVGGFGGTGMFHCTSMLHLMLILYCSIYSLTVNHTSTAFNITTTAAAQGSGSSHKVGGSIQHMSKCPWARN